METVEVTDQEMFLYLAAEQKASNDYWAAEHEMQKLDRLRNQLRGNADFDAIYQAALQRFYAARKVANQYGVLL